MGGLGLGAAVMLYVLEGLSCGGWSPLCRNGICGCRLRGDRMCASVEGPSVCGAPLGALTPGPWKGALVCGSMISPGFSLTSQVHP